MTTAQPKATTDLRKVFTADVAASVGNMLYAAKKSGNPSAYISVMLDTIRDEHPDQLGTSLCNALLYSAEDAGLLGA